ncbi:MAG: restriction endonuclease [Thermoleophilaceae bacterium]|nr:restriction endonuclease [Thermoleophilaceae bacterium]
MAPVRYLETGVLHCGDNEHLLAEFPAACIDLIYLDPPFFSNKNYEVIWGDEAEVRSFEDRWEGGIQHYIGWMKPRLRQMQRILKPEGSIYLHCDPAASHYLKVLMDELFGTRSYRNEIIWKRTTAHSSAKRWAPVHDVLLYYGNGKTPVWNPPREDYDPAYLDRYYKFDDGDGRLYWRADITGAGTRKGSTGQPWRGVDPTAIGRHWMVPPDELDQLDAEGRIYWPPKGKMPQHKRYREDLKGKAVSDIWAEIDRINPVGAERLGYPTQKPEALLERIVRASSNPGDIVLDPFCGCGTTIAVAHQLKREWIGIDISPTAVNLMKRRMTKQGATVKAEGLPISATDLKSLRPFEFQNWVIQRVIGTHSPRKSGDMGIDGYSFFEQLPIQVKQSESVGRNVVDNFETAVERSGKHMGYIVAFSFTRGAHEEAARAKARGKAAIVLVKVADLVRLGDLIESADDNDQVPDLTRETPDLMRLFSAAQERGPDRALPMARRRDARPANKELIESARARKVGVETPRA